MKALLDTNILIDYLNGIDDARKEIRRYETPLISPVTWIEVMIGATSPEERGIRIFLNRFSLVPVDSVVSEKAAAVRRDYRIRLPDAIIWASAQVAEALLVSRNTRDFPADSPSVRVPYTL